MIKNSSLIEKKLHSLLHLVISRLNNLNNADPYTNGEYRFLNNYFSVRKQDKYIFFDVGANIGDYSYAVMKSAQVQQPGSHIESFLFEPNVYAFKKLTERFVSRNTHVFNQGLSNVVSKKTIFFDSDVSSHTSVYNREIDGKHTLDKHLTASFTTGEKICKQNRLQTIDLLKIDVEGHELEVLEGFGSFLDPNKIHCVQFEYSDTYLDSRHLLRDVIQLLTNRGYSITKIFPQTLKYFSYHRFHENFQYSNYVALGKPWMK